MNSAGATEYMSMECAGRLDTGGSLEGGLSTRTAQWESEEKLVISAYNMDIRERPRSQGDVFSAMVYLGANVNLGPVRLAKALGLVIVPHVDGRKIGTADTAG